MNHYQNMDGAWSFAFASYYNENVTQDFLNPKTHEIWSVEDMYCKHLPKYVGPLSNFEQSIQTTDFLNLKCKGLL